MDGNFVLNVDIQNVLKFFSKLGVSILAAYRMGYENFYFLRLLFFLK